MIRSYMSNLLLIHLFFTLDNHLKNMITFVREIHYFKK